MSTTILPDGTVISAALSYGPPKDANHSFFNEMGIFEGQIEEILTVDNPQNSPGNSGKFTLFNVRITRHDGATELVPRCRAIQSFMGGALNNFIEVLPPDPGPSAKKGANSSLKRGTKVIVAFVGGQRTNGVILGAAPHPSPVATARRPSKSKGTYLETEFQGLNYQIANDGSCKVTFNGPRDDSGAIIGDAGPTTVTIDAQGVFTITNNAKQLVTIDRISQKIIAQSDKTQVIIDAKADKIQVQAKIVEIGDENLQPQVVGDDWKKIMEQLIDAIIAIVVPTGVGPSGNPLNTQQFLFIRNQLKEALSKNHKVEK